MTWWDEMRWDDEMRWWDEMIRWYEMRWNMRWDEMRWWDDARHIDCVMSLHSCPFVYLSVCRSVAIYSFFLLIVIYHSRNSSSICQTVWGEKTWKTSDPLTYVGNWHAKSNQNTRLVCSFLYHKSSAREIRLKVEFAPIVALLWKLRSSSSPSSSSIIIIIIPSHPIPSHHTAPKKQP